MTTIPVLFISFFSFLSICHFASSVNSVNRNSTIPVSCGLRNLDGIGFKIAVKSNYAQFGEYPWMAALLNAERIESGAFEAYICGGAIIAPNVVITAAHCIEYIRSTNNLIVRAGDWDLSSTMEILPHQDRKVKEIIKHEGYETFDHQTQNDIALIVLKTSFDLTSNVQTICLPSDTFLEVTNKSGCIVSAWGKFSSDYLSNKRESILRAISMPILQENQCKGVSFVPAQSCLCAGGEMTETICATTSGSPLACPGADSKTQYYLTGLVSASLTPCDSKKHRRVFVNVVFYQEWINEQLKRVSNEK